MPFYLRKSLKLGPVRLNFSKSGMGVSAGVKGARIGVGPRGTYIHAGRNGIYYRKTLSSPRKQNFVSPNQREKETTTVHTIPTAHASDLVDSSNQETLSRINRRAQRTSISPFVIGLVAVALAIALGSIVPVILGVLLAWAAYHLEKALHPIELNYHLETVYEKRFEAVKEALRALGSAERVWRVISESPTYDWKRNAGANKLLQRRPVVVGSLVAPFIRTNVEVYGIDLKSLKLFFFPDQIFVFQDGKYGSVSYESLEVQASSTRFIEDGAVPKDSQIVDHTWRFVRKNGGPDRRFNNNRKLPVVRYGLLELISSTGLNLHLHVSLESIVQPFAKVLEAVKYLQADDQVHQTTASSQHTQSQTEHKNRERNQRQQSQSSKTKSSNERAGANPKIDWAFQILGISSSASADEVTESYRRLAQRYHPDKVAHLGPEFRELAENRMKEVNQAYSVLRKSA